MKARHTLVRTALGLILALGTTSAPTIAQANIAVPGRSTLLFQQKTRQIVRVDYNQRNKDMAILLSDGHVLRLEGKLAKSSNRLVYIVKTGSFTTNYDADVSGKLYVTIQNNKLKDLSGTVLFDGQSILLNYSPDTDATYSGSGYLVLTEERLPFTSVVYTDGSGLSRILKLNLTDNRVLKLYGTINEPNGKQFTIQRGEILPLPKQTDKKKPIVKPVITGTINLQLTNHHIRGLNGQIKIDKELIKVEFTTNE